MPESLLTILKFCLLAVLYLFFARVLRAVWASVNALPSREAPAPAPPAAAVAAPAPRTVPVAAAVPAAAPDGVRRLRVVEPPDASGRVFELGDELTVGRAPGCQVALDDTFASAHHARVFRRDAKVYVEDLGSTNGTYLNRELVSRPIEVRRGDRLQVGRTVLEVDA